MDKIRVYVNSVAPAAVDYVDMKSVEHPCSQAGERAFEGMKNLPPRSSGFLSDEERKAIEIVEQFCREKALVRDNRPGICKSDDPAEVHPKKVESSCNKLWKQNHQRTPNKTAT